jgi:hypothetical protein
MATLDDYKQQLANLLRNTSNTITNLPTEAQRFMYNPQAFTQMFGQNQLPRETGFAEGAMVGDRKYGSEQGFAEGEPLALPLALAGMGAGAVGVARNPKLVARLESPFHSPQASTEAAQTPTKTLLNASGDPVAESLSRQRFETAASPSLLKNVKQRQGVWEAETNPMFLSTLTKGGRLDFRKDLIKDVVQTAENLEQAGAGVIRAIPLRFGGLDKGDSAIFTVGKKPLSNEQVSEMSKIVGDRAAIQHRADGTAVLIPFDPSQLKTIAAEIQTALPTFKAKPALSQEGFDRLYYPRSDYAKEGAVAREANIKGQLTQAFDELLKKKGYRE